MAKAHPPKKTQWGFHYLRFKRDLQLGKTYLQGTQFRSSLQFVSRIKRLLQLCWACQLIVCFHQISFGLSPNVVGHSVRQQCKQLARLHLSGFMVVLSLNTNIKLVLFLNNMTWVTIMKVMDVFTARMIVVHASASVLTKCLCDLFFVIFWVCQVKAPTPPPYSFM